MMSDAMTVMMISGDGDDDDDGDEARRQILNMMVPVGGPVSINCHRIRGPPHSLRRSGPASDACFHRRALEEIRRRGRWVAISSVHRYSKDWLIPRHMSFLPAPVLSVGEAFLADPRRTIRAYLAERTEPLARRLEHYLSQSSELVFQSRPALAAALEPKA